MTTKQTTARDLTGEHILKLAKIVAALDDKQSISLARLR